MDFRSDNCGPVHPEVMAALISANHGAETSYGNDALMDLVRKRIREVFEAPEAAVYLVVNGTAANALALACLVQPWDAVFCTPLAHVNCDECNAPEFFTGGAKLVPVGDADRMTPESLRAAIAPYATGDLHMAQPGAVTLTEVTELGALNGPRDIAALSAVAKEYGCAVHLDGARLGNALAALDCAPADLTWRAGVDMLSFGGTKNGLMGVEAVVLFDPALARQFELRRKRAGHLMSKHRFLAAQMLAYLTDDLWLRSARRANANCARLAAGMTASGKVTFVHEPLTNMFFFRMARAEHLRVRAAGARYFVHGPLDGPAEEHVLARMVCDWSVEDEQIDAYLTLLAS